MKTPPTCALLRGCIVAAVLLAVPLDGTLRAQAGGPEEAAPVIDVETAPRPTAGVTRVRWHVELDAVLDEEAWSRAEVITGFVQSTPRTGAPATERTEVRIVYDDEALYFGAHMYDSRPSAITAQYMEQDFETRDEDIFAVALDTFLDRRNSFLFLINPNGAVKDIQTFDDSRSLNVAWEGVVEVETRIADDGWIVEMAVPLTTLRFDPGKEEQAWGLQLLRRIRRKAEDVYWAPVDRRTRLHKMSRAGTLEGLGDLSAGRNLTVKPYALAATSSGSAVAPGDGGEEWDGGLDLKYGITPRLTLDLTARTDFSQVEVDQERVNLTRFSLFFPEKRDFFMENAGTFAFGDLSERNYRLGASSRDFQLFHSRRIGLHGGQPIPIHGGGRLTGRVGDFQVGFLNMQTETSDVLPGENFTVARLRRTLFGTADVGGMFINRQATGSGDGYNRSYGADANVRLFQDLIVHSYLAATDDPGATGNNRAARVSAAYRDAFWNVSALYREIGDAFRPEVGFVRRTGIRHHYATVGVHPKPGHPLLVEVSPYAEMHYITDLGSLLETREATAGMGVDFWDGGQLRASYTDRFERIDDPFVVAGGGEVPVGDYDFREASLMYQSSAGRSLSGRVRLAGGGFFSGDKRTLDVGVSWSPSPHVSAEVNAQHNDITLPQGSFTADVIGGRVSLAYSTRVLGSAFVQYNSAAEEMITNLRLNFIHAPLSDLFLVYTERRDTDGGGLLDSRLTVKATRLFSF